MPAITYVSINRNTVYDFVLVHGLPGLRGRDAAEVAIRARVTTLENLMIAFVGLAKEERVGLVKAG